MHVFSASSAYYLIHYICENGIADFEIWLTISRVLPIWGQLITKYHKFILKVTHQGHTCWLNL